MHIVLKIKIIKLLCSLLLIPCSMKEPSILKLIGNSSRIRYRVETYLHHLFKSNDQLGDMFTKFLCHSRLEFMFQVGLI
jgi:hypothetical protein